MGLEVEAAHHVHQIDLDHKVRRDSEVDLNKHSLEDLHFDQDHLLTVELSVGEERRERLERKDKFNITYLGMW